MALTKIEIELLRRFIELKFRIRKEELKNLYHKDKEKFKEVVNWLYWNKSLNISDIVRTIYWPIASRYYKKVAEVLERKREITWHNKDRLSTSSKIKIMGLILTDMYVVDTDKYNNRHNRIQLFTASTNYFSCKIFFNVLNKVKHVSICPRLTSTSYIGNEYCLEIMFSISLSKKNFEDVNIFDKNEILKYVKNLNNIDLLYDFLTMVVIGDGSIYKSKVMIYQKDINILQLLGEILKEKTHIKYKIFKVTKGKETKSSYMWYLYTSDKKLVNEIWKRIKMIYPYKTRGNSIGSCKAYLWLLNRFSETPTGGIKILLKLLNY